MADRYCSDWYEEKPEYLQKEDAKAFDKRRHGAKDRDWFDINKNQAMSLANHRRYLLSVDTGNFSRTPLETAEFARQTGYWEGYAYRSAYERNKEQLTRALQELTSLYLRLRNRENPIYDPMTADWLNAKEEWK